MAKQRVAAEGQAGDAAWQASEATVRLECDMMTARFTVSTSRTLDNVSIARQWLRA